MWIALLSFLVGFACNFLQLSICSWRMLPALVAPGKTGAEFMVIGIPLLTLIWGLSLQIFTPFGWWVSFLSQVFFISFFGYQFVQLWKKIIFEQKVLEAQNSGISEMTYLLQESLVANTFIVIICTFASIYLLLPIIKRLYFS